MTDAEAPLDLVGVGVGPANLSLAALADAVPGLRTAFLEQRPAFHWHPGLLIDGQALQVPFLADLVSLVEPAGPWSFLSYLRASGRLYPFYFAERFHVDRAEYDAYCRWVSERLPSCRFGQRVDRVDWDHARGLFTVDVTPTSRDDRPARPPTRLYARHVVLGIGTAPRLPAPLRPLADTEGTPDTPGAPDTPGGPVHHAADYLTYRADLLDAGHVTVVGAGQSGAEVFLDLLRRRPPGRERLTWLARTPAFAPMEYSKLGLEQFTPDHTRYFHGLPEPVRDRLVPAQWQLYKGVSAETLGAIHDELYRRTLTGGWPDAALLPGVTVSGAARTSDGRLRLDVHHTHQDTTASLETDAVVAATGYTERPAHALTDALRAEVARDAAGRFRVDAAYRLETSDTVAGSVFVQNAERHTHGVGAPDLGLAAWRSAVILNTLSGREVYPLPARTAFTSFGLGGDGPPSGAGAAWPGTAAGGVGNPPAAGSDTAARRPGG